MNPITAVIIYLVSSVLLVGGVLYFVFVERIDLIVFLVIFYLVVVFLAWYYGLWKN